MSFSVLFLCNFWARIRNVELINLLDYIYHFVNCFCKVFWICTLIPAHLVDFWGRAISFKHDSIWVKINHCFYIIGRINHFSAWLLELDRLWFCWSFAGFRWFCLNSIQWDWNWYSLCLLFTNLQECILFWGCIIKQFVWTLSSFLTRIYHITLCLYTFRLKWIIKRVCNNNFFFRKHSIFFWLNSVEQKLILILQWILLNQYRIHCMRIHPVLSP